MSTFGSKADIAYCSANVRFWPKHITLSNPNPLKITHSNSLTINKKTNNTQLTHKHNKTLKQLTTPLKRSKLLTNQLLIYKLSNT